MKITQIALLSVVLMSCSQAGDTAHGTCNPLPQRPNIELAEVHLAECLDRLDGIPGFKSFAPPSEAYSSASLEAREAIAALKEDGVTQLHPANSALLNEKLAILRNELEKRGNLLGGDRV